MTRTLLGSALAAASFLVPAQAFGQSHVWTQGPLVVSAANVPYATLGAGAPAVTVDERSHNRLIMAFEYPVTAANPADPLCPSGVWGIGLMQSLSGLTWTNLDGDNNVATGVGGASPLVVPVPGGGTSHDCVMAHPSVLWGSVPNNLVVWIYYKAQDDAGSNFTGVGLLEVQFLGNGRVQSVVDHGIVLPITETFGYSDVQQRPDGSYYMLVQKKLTGVTEYELHEATAPAEIGPWTLSGPVISPSDFGYAWAGSEFASPDLFCGDDDPGDGFDEIHAMVVGRTLGVGGVFTNGGFGEAVRVEDGLSVYSVQDPPEVTYTNARLYKHISLLQLSVAGVQQFVMYSSELSVAGRPQIRVGYTTPAPGFAITTVLSDRCP